MRKKSLLGIRSSRSRAAALASAASAAIGLLGFVSHSHADVLYWTGGADGTTWATDANWSTAAAATGSTVSTYSPISTTTAYFDATSGVTTPPINTVLGAPTSVYQVNVQASAGLVLNNDTNSDALSIGAGGVTIATGSGPVNIAAPITLTASANFYNGYTGTAAGHIATLSGGITDASSTLQFNAYQNSANGWVLTNGGNANATLSIGGNLVVYWQPVTVNIPVSVTANSTWSIGGVSTGVGTLTTNSLITLATGTTLTAAPYQLGYNAAPLNINGGLSATNGGTFIAGNTLTTLTVNIGGTFSGGSSASTALTMNTSTEAGQDINAANALALTGYISVNGELYLKANTTVYGNVNFAYVTGGGGTLIAGNGGVVNVSGYNSNASASSILSGGTFLANASGANGATYGSAGSGGYTVVSGGMLAGSGYVEGTSASYANHTITIPDGAFISSGNGQTTGGTTGTLNLVNGFTSGHTALTLALGSSTSNASNYVWKINDATATTGSGTGAGGADGWDLLQIYSMTTSGSGQVQIDAYGFSDPNGDAGAPAGFSQYSNYQWEIATLTTGSFNASNFYLDDSNLEAALGDPAGTFSVSVSGSNLYIDYAGIAVPEPATLGLLGGISALALLRRRRGFRLH